MDKDTLWWILIESKKLFSSANRKEGKLQPPHHIDSPLPQLLAMEVVSDIIVVYTTFRSESQTDRREKKNSIRARDRAEDDSEVGLADRNPDA